MTALVDGAPPPNPADVAELRGNATPRDIPSFHSVYAEHFDFVWRCTRRLGVAAPDVDDVVQDVFIVVHNRLDTVERLEVLRSWLYGVVRRTVSTYHRNQKKHSAAIVEELPTALPPTPVDLAEQTEDVRLLYSLIAQVDDTRREVFVLAELEEMTMPAIADAVGIPINTAYSRLRLARAEFDKALVRYLASEKSLGRRCLT